MAVRAKAVILQSIKNIIVFMDRLHRHTQTMGRRKYIFVTGGVVSSLGKGIISASIGKLLQARGYKVTIQKFDPYINIDPGTLNPYEHGECYVTEDGFETDLDLGHYERFTGIHTTRNNSITTGRIYKTVIDRERHGDYLGKTIQVVPHITDEIKRRMLREEEKDEQLDFVITEVGGTIGDIESAPFMEAIRQLRWQLGRNAVCVHLTYVPYLKAADELNAATKAMTDHHTACDTYDGLAPQTLQIVDNNAEKKFATLEAYATMKNLVAKYEVTKEEEIQGEGDEQKTVTVYKFKVLTDDDELAAANKEIEGAINLTNLLFTEGVSTPENSNGGKGTGIAVFIDRLRLGAEDLKGLGVAEDDELVVKANNALTDDDDLAQYLMTRTTQEVYGKLKDADDKFFQTITVDDETLEETVEPKEYDMTVFVKNPNIYKQQPNMNFTLENVPGWTTPDGYNQPGLSVGWGAPKNIEGVAEDCMFQTWGAAYRAEQTITNLPVGIYTVKFGFGERNDDASNEFNLAYVKTSKIKEGEQFTDSIQPKVIGQAFPFAGATNAAIIDSVEVKDGLLTIGVNAGNGSHTFFNEVRLVLVGAVKDFDYGKAYADGIETIENKEAVRVRAIELYDLNGRRVTKATKGLVIMKKVMNDGTVRTQKVVK